MRKKVFLALISIILFSGCTVEYNLTISDNTIHEDINISELKSLVDEETSDSIIKNQYAQYNNEGRYKYITSKNKTDDNVIYKLKQNYPLRNELYIRAFDDCFDGYNIMYSDDSKTSYIIQTTKGFKCMQYEYSNIDSYTINIKVDTEVINNNADKVNGDTYTWIINSDNFLTKDISIEFKVKEINTNNKKEQKNNILSFAIMGIIFGIVFVALFMIMLYMYIINKKQNKL